MRLLTILIGISVLLVATPEAEAIPNAMGQYAIFGIGGDLCSTWTKNHADKNSSAKEEDSWLFGYLTAVDRWADGPNDVVRNSDQNASIGWMMVRCTNHPDDTLDKAAEGFLVWLGLHGGLLKNR